MMSNAFMVFILLGLGMAFVGNVILVFANDTPMRPMGVFMNTSGLSVIGTVLFADWLFI